MAGEASDTNMNPPIVDTTITERKNELKLTPPKPFTGKWNELKKFIQDCILYLHINDHVYDTEAKKVASPYHSWMKEMQEPLKNNS